MIKVKVFYDIRDYSKKRWVSADEQINEFITNNSIEVIDVKFHVTSGEDSRVHLLLIYREV
jgi:hypothetical protein